MKSTPLIRWAGSKRQLVPLLSSCWPGDNYRYIEPFMGSACLFFAISPRKAILSDSNIELTNTFDQIRKHPERIYQALKRIPRDSESYYILRAKEVGSLNRFDRATRFLFLNRFCFNGLYRTNLKGQFNVPFSGSKTGDFPSWENFSSAAYMLRNVDLKCGDFSTIVSNEVKANDFVYLDPPYAVKNSKIFNQYGPQTFGLKDLERLKEVLHKIDSANARFLLSYANCKEAQEMFKEWPMVKVEVQRNIAGFAKHRRRESEILISNFNCESLTKFKNDQLTTRDH